ncbi:MAG: universal stress protein [Saprospiraceae bacterium]|nr:universal stress protein [Saprospiraceae bacterium]
MRTKTICVPIDFSPNSFSAYHYASQLAHASGAELILLNVINGSFGTNHALGYQPVREIENAVLARLRYFAVEYPHEVGVMIKNVPIQYMVRYGIPGFTIANFCKDQDIYLMVMGTRDKHGIFDKIIGTTSATVIQLSTCPILTIHENTLYQPLEKIVFGYNDEDGIDDAVEFIKEYNATFNANIDFVHVSKNGDRDELEEVVDEIVDEMLSDNSPYSFEVKRIKGTDPSNSLIDYCLNHKADMLVLQHKRVGFFERLFKKSISIKSAHDFHLPVLICPDDD